jgi:hypothetical protein
MPKEHEHSVYRFHTDLFLSGLERIILVSFKIISFQFCLITSHPQISRKASTTYYPTLHLELARYIAYATRTGYELPYTVARLIGLPPPAHAKNPQAVPLSPSGHNTPSRGTTPNRRPPGVYGNPGLLSPFKIEVRLTTLTTGGQ